MAEELTLESLARRVERLEQLLEMQSRNLREKDWRRVIGMFRDSEFARQIDEAGRAIRQADREAADTCLFVESDNPGVVNEPE